MAICIHGGGAAKLVGAAATVSGGILSITPASTFADGAAIRLATGGTLNLRTAGTNITSGGSLNVASGQTNLAPGSALTNEGTLTANNNLLLQGDFINQAGATANLTNVTIGGSGYNHGTFNVGGLVTIAGPIAQQLGGEACRVGHQPFIAFANAGQCACIDLHLL